MTLETEIAIAIINKEKAYKGIQLPTPQTAGTDNRTKSRMVYRRRK